MRALPRARPMAGGVSKTFGAIFTLLGVLALAGGFVAFGWGLFTLEEESERAFPDERRMEAALAVVAVGLAVAAVAFLLLLVGLPLLVYGVHRVHDPATGGTRTLPGGALKAWGVTLLVLGAATLLAGLLASAFGAGVVGEETGRLFPNDGRAQAAAILSAGALAVAGLGLVLVIVGIPLLVAGSSRANAAAHASGQAPPAASSAGVVLGVVVGAVAVALLLMFAFGGTTPGSGADDDRGRATTAVFNGSIEGGGAPVLGTVGAGGERAQHVVTPQTRRGVVEAALGWEPTTARGPLVLLIEAATADGGWREIARAEGGSPLTAASGAEPLPGDVRVTVSFAEASGGAVEYTLVVNVSPS